MQHVPCVAPAKAYTNTYTTDKPSSDVKLRCVDMMAMTDGSWYDIVKTQHEDLSTY